MWFLDLLVSDMKKWKMVMISVTDEILLCFCFSVMRPPAGDYDENTLEVLGQLGYK